MNVFLIHGAYGNPNENWFPWLRRELEELGYEVFAPAFPTPENQTLENWLKVFQKYEHLVDPDSIFVGHSLGCAFILNFLDRTRKCVKAVYLVAGFISPIGKEKFDRLNESFYDELDWEKLRGQAKYFVYASDNDPYVPLENENELARKLGAKFVMVKGAGHFNKKSGYTKFKRLVEEVKSFT